MKIRTEVINLPLSDIYSHPDNPRKDLGDITELTESIEKNGLMQNLTVIPGHWTGNGDEYSYQGWTLLIGHRRCAAARAAGLTVAPCRIIEGSTRNEQVGIMLEENMQRSDLTVFEQAEGFQLMLDLGETVDTLSEKTGFSKSTIYHRTNLAKLDKEALKKVDEDSFQLSLSDLYELEKIKDIEKRNEILKRSHKSENIKWEVEKVLKEERMNKRSIEIEELLEQNGIPKMSDEDYSNRWSKFVTIKILSTNDNKIELPEDIPANACYAMSNYGMEKEYSIYKPKEAKVEQADPKSVRKKEVLDALEALEKGLKNHLRDFYQLIIDDEYTFEKDPEYLRQLWKSAVKIGFECDVETLIEALTDEEPEEESEEYKELVQQALDMPSEKQLIIFIYNETEYSKLFRNWYSEIDKWSLEKIMPVIDVFKHHGFQLEEEEQQFLNGTHPLWKEWKELKDE